MEGIIQLRDLVENPRCGSCCRPLSISQRLCITGSGFYGSAETDLYTCCHKHGIQHSHGQLKKYETTHLVIPLTMKDLLLCREYADRVLKSENVIACWTHGTPVVTLDWLFDIVSCVCSSCHILVSSRRDNNSCTLSDAVSLIQDVERYEWTRDHMFHPHQDESSSPTHISPSPIVYSTYKESEDNVCDDNVAVGQESPCQVRDITSPPFQAAQEATDASQHTQDTWAFPSWEETPPISRSFHSNKQRREEEGDYDEGEERTPDAVDEEERMNLFAALRVTPLTEIQPSSNQQHSCNDLQHDMKKLSISHTSSSSHTFESGGRLIDMLENIIPSDVCIPGDLLLKPPRGNAVRKRHDISSRSTGIIQFTNSMTLKHLDFLTICTQRQKHVALDVLDVNGEILLVKPYWFYKIAGQDWMVEYKRFYTGKEVGKEADHLTDCDQELFISTELDATEAHRIIKKSQVQYIRMSGLTKPLPMKSTSTDTVSMYYSHTYNPRSKNVIM
jgi:hypothetical protein